MPNLNGEPTVPNLTIHVYVDGVERNDVTVYTDTQATPSTHVEGLAPLFEVVPPEGFTTMTYTIGVAASGYDVTWINHATGTSVGKGTAISQTFDLNTSPLQIDLEAHLTSASPQIPWGIVVLLGVLGAVALGYTLYKK
jgi:hypothetical protein